MEKAVASKYGSRQAKSEYSDRKGTQNGKHRRRGNSDQFGFPRISIRFEQLMDAPISDEEKILQALELYYPFPVSDISKQSIINAVVLCSGKRWGKDQGQAGNGYKIYTLFL